MHGADLHRTSHWHFVKCLNTHALSFQTQILPRATGLRSWDNGSEKGESAPCCFLPEQSALLYALIQAPTKYKHNIKPEIQYTKPIAVWPDTGS